MPSRSPSASTTARLNRPWGASGMTIMPWARGDTSGPPAANAYAVDPCGVAAITPSLA